MTPTRGFTLTEVLIGSVVFTVVAGGAMVAMLTAARLNRSTNHTQFADANVLAQQTIEKFRNLVACDNASFFNPADCSLIAIPLPSAWTSDDIPPDATTERLQVAKRCFRFRNDATAQCPGETCLAIDVKVCWNNEPAATCPCP